MSSERRVRQQGYPVAALLAVMFVGSLLPFFALVLLGARQHISEATAENFAQLSQQSTALAQAVDRELRGFLDTVQVMAQTETLQQGDVSAIKMYLRSAAQHTGGHFILISRTLHQLVNTAAPEDVPLPEATDIEAARRIFATGQPMVRDLTIDPILGEPLFAVKVPVVVEGATVYVLTYIPRKGAAADVVVQTFRPEGWFASVVDSRGTVIVHSHNPQRYGAKSVWQSEKQPPGLVFEMVDDEGRLSFVSQSPSKLSEWRAFVWQPKVLFEEQLDQYIAAAKLSVILALVGSGAAGFLSGSAIQSALRRLAAAAVQVGQSRRMDYRATFVREANEVAARLTDAANQITAREQDLRKNEDRIRLILRELNHRSKNLLAVIQVMARQTARTSTDPMDFQKTFSERLAGIARSQDILIERRWGAVPVRELMNAHLSPFRKADERIECGGPDVALEASAAQDIGMILHELATNAVKYGALSTPSGRIRIEWRRLAGLAGKHGLELRWMEMGGPAVSPPARKGFGHTLLQRVVASFGGSAEIGWRKDGLICTILVPHGCLSEQSSVAS